MKSGLLITASWAALRGSMKDADHCREEAGIPPSNCQDDTLLLDRTASKEADTPNVRSLQTPRVVTTADANDANMS